MSFIQRIKDLVTTSSSKAKALVSTGVDKGKTAAQAVKDERRRKALVLELGELVHGAATSGDDVSEDQARLIAAIDEIDAAADDPDVTATDADGSTDDDSNS